MTALRRGHTLWGKPGTSPSPGSSGPGGELPDGRERGRSSLEVGEALHTRRSRPRELPRMICVTVRRVAEAAMAKRKLEFPREIFRIQGAKEGAQMIADTRSAGEQGRTGNSVACSDRRGDRGGRRARCRAQRRRGCLETGRAKGARNLAILGEAAENGVEAAAGVIADVARAMLPDHAARKDRSTKRRPQLRH